MGFYTSGALLSDLRSTANMGASTSEFPYLPTLALNVYGVVGTLPDLQMSGEDTVSNDYILYTDSEDPPKLPALELSVSADDKISTSSDGIKLPLLELSAVCGLELSEKLPTVSSSATASTPTLMSVDETLSDMELSARDGIRASSDLNLPVMSLSVSITGDLVGQLDKTIPGLDISATGSGGLTGTLSKDLPPLSLSVSISTVVGSNLSKNLSAFKISATGSLNDYGTLSVDLPGLNITAGEAHGLSMSLDAKIATLLSQIVSSGIDGVGGTGSTAIRSNRFTDYVLRYSR